MKLRLFLVVTLATALSFSFSKKADEPTVKDADGNEYAIFEHNGYLIMAENLRTTKFQNGEKLSKTTNWKKWEAGIQNNEPMYAMYNDMKEFQKMGGGNLYNPAAVTSEKGLAPEGWHIPSYEEWQEIFFEGTETEIHNVYTITDEVLTKDRKSAKKNGTELHISRKFAALGSGYRRANGTYPSKSFITTYLAMADGQGCFELSLMGRNSIGSHLRRSLPEENAAIAVRCVRKL
ncbi:fibrobacter succinogenes major paralogous domain-containing protein [Cryomorphaceae bacterium]|nr:fibrobacter succinogenes major paralogous domain-containing protein [Cryomorphaceae bacterium]